MTIRPKTTALKAKSILTRMRTFIMVATTCAPTERPLPAAPVGDGLDVVELVGVSAESCDGGAEATVGEAWL